MKRYWFAFCQSDLILEKVTDDIYTIPFSEDAPAFVKSSATVHTITPFSDGTEVRAVRIDQPKPTIRNMRCAGFAHLITSSTSIYTIKPGSAKKFFIGIKIHAFAVYVAVR